MLNALSARRIATAIHTPQEADALLNALHEILMRYGLSGIYTLLLTDAECTYSEVHTSTLPGLKTGEILRAAADTLAYCIRYRLPMYFPSPRTVAHGESTIEAAALCPLQRDDEIYGAILLHESISESSHEAFEFIIEQLGLALWRVRFEELIQRQHAASTAQLRAIARAGDILRGFDLDVVLGKFMELALATVDAEAGCIILLEGFPPTLTYRIEWGLDAETLERLQLQDGTIFVHTVIDAGKPTIIHHIGTENSFVPDPVLSRFDNLAIVPLTTRDRVLGGLVVANFTVGSKQDLELLRTVVEISSTAIENARLHRQALEREALRKKLRIAGEIQYGLLPHWQPTLPGIALAARNIPCDESSGDYFDFFLLDEHRLGFVVGDATGHGIGAALITTTVRAFLRALVSTIEHPGQLFSRLNNLAVADFQDGKFVTLFFGVYDTRDRRMTYASAGHSPPLMIYRHHQDRFEHLKATGLPLGILPETPYEQHTTTPLAAGDLILLLTDGIHEAASETGDRFGIKRLIDVVRAHRQAEPEDLIDIVYTSVCQFCGAAPQKDDITLLCLRATDT